MSFSLSFKMCIDSSNKFFLCLNSWFRETFNSLSKDKKGKVFDNLKEAYNHFGKIVHNNDLLMVKGSNATGLNRFSKNIKRGHVDAI